MVTVKYVTLALKRLSGGISISKVVNRSIHVPSIRIRSRQRLSIPSDRHIQQPDNVIQQALFSLSVNHRDLPVCIQTRSG